MSLPLAAFQSIIDTFEADPETGVVYRTLGFMGFPDYRIGTDGSAWSRRVYGSKSRRIGDWWEMKKKTSKRCYFYVDLFATVGLPKRLMIHWLVLFAFDGPRPPMMEGRHLNDVRRDNRIENLAWGTRVQNRRDAMRNGKIQHGERSHKATHLKDDDVREIRRRAADGESKPAIAKLFGVRNNYIHRIVNREIWRHVTDQSGSSPVQESAAPLKKS